MMRNYPRTESGEIVAIFDVIFVKARKEQQIIFELLDKEKPMILQRLK